MSPSKEKCLSYKQQHLDIVSSENGVCYFGRVPENLRFQLGDRLILFQIGLFHLLKETHVSLQRETFFLEAGTNTTWFLCENCVSF
jgi:hypothetical protein